MFALTYSSEVSQAYEILSDPDKRKIYDQYGLDFILRGGPAPPEPGEGGMPGGFGGFPGGFGGMPGGGGGARTFHFSTGGGGGPGAGGFSFSNPEDIFSSFFASAGGGGGGHGIGGMGGMGGDDDMFAGMGGMPGGFGGMGGAPRMRAGGAGPRRPQTPEVTVLEKPLPITLEDLFSGTTKRLKINRKTFDPQTGKQSTQEKIVEVPIKKGLKAGSKIKFSNIGDQIEGGTQDIHFVVAEKAHPMFKREGDDLRHDVEIDLKEALTGWKRVVSTIDGKQVNVGGSGPTPPTYTDRFPNLGMPKSKTPSQRGDLVVGVKIKFPQSLTPDQKAKLKEIL